MNIAITYFNMSAVSHTTPTHSSSLGGVLFLNLGFLAPQCVTHYEPLA